MDWFERLTGFPETSYDAARSRLSVCDERLVSEANGRSYGIGRLTLPSLSELREHTPRIRTPARSGSVSIVRGDVRRLHSRPEFRGALFQVASQFNALEMIGPSVTPEHGVTRYQDDPTQGPACAIAAGAATIYRNYFAQVGGGLGQTRDRQIDTLCDLRETLAAALGRSPDDLWSMRNGYLEMDRASLDDICRRLESLAQSELDRLRCAVRIALHADVEVTHADLPGPRVSQAFCSALPIAYSGIPARHWRPFAALVLEAAYEATLLAGALNADRGQSSTVLLTLLGGGAFGNEEDRILGAMARGIAATRRFGLDVRVVCFGEPSRALVDLLAS